MMTLTARVKKLYSDPVYTAQQLRVENRRDSVILICLVLRCDVAFGQAVTALQVLTHLLNLYFKTLAGQKRSVTYIRRANKSNVLFFLHATIHLKIKRIIHTQKRTNHAKISSMHKTRSQLL